MTTIAEPSGDQSQAFGSTKVSALMGRTSLPSASATFDIPTSTTLVGAGVHSAVTAGTYYDGASVTSQAFASQGTYTVTFTFTES